MNLSIELGEGALTLLLIFTLVLAGIVTPGQFLGLAFLLLPTVSNKSE